MNGTLDDLLTSTVPDVPPVPLSERGDGNREPWPTCEECGAELVEVRSAWFECPACHPEEFYTPPHLAAAPLEEE